jgi:S1-C subfamily serine protease
MRLLSIAAPIFITLMSAFAFATPTQSPAADNDALTPQQIAKQAFPSVIMVTVDDQHGQPLALGSGFIYCPGIAVTNLHVMDGGHNATIRVVGQKEGIRVLGISKIDERNDLAFLAFEKRELPPLPLATRQPEIGDDVYVIGNPQGLEGTFSAGLVSGIRKVESDSVLQITAPISQGSSGGPVLNNRGQVVGMAVAAMRDGQNLNFAIPVTAIRSAGTKLTTPKPISAALLEVNKETRSVVRDSGGQDLIGVKLHSFAWEDLGRISFSVKNQLDTPIQSVRILAIFYAADGEPLDTSSAIIIDTIGNKLASRETIFVDNTVRRLAETADKERYPLGIRVEFRILSFRVVE